VLEGLALSAGTGLAVNVSEGKAVLRKLVEKSAGVVNGLPASATTYIWLRDDGIFTQTPDLTPPTGPHTLLGSATTDENGVTGVDCGIAWKGSRVEDGPKQVFGPGALTVCLNEAKVGVGTDSPADTLHVSGTARVEAISLPERGSAPPPASGRGHLYTKSSGGVTELFYRDASGTEVQVTENGALRATNRLALAGGTMAGTIAMGGSNKLTGLADGTADGDAVNYGQLRKHSIRTFVLNTQSQSLSAGITRYEPLSGYRGPNSPNEEFTQVKMFDFAYTFRNLRVYVSTNSLQAASTVVLRDDGADTDLSVNIGSWMTGAFESTSQVSVAAGSVCNYKVQAGGTGSYMLVVESVQVDAVSS
jgi:hypothetical protein